MSRPTTDELIQHFLPIAEAEACKAIEKYPEFEYIREDLKQEAALRLVEISQPDSLKWDKNLEKDENLRKINVFVRIAVRRRCIDIFRKEGLRGERFQPRTDMHFLANWSDGWFETEALERLTPEETVVLDLFFQEKSVKEIKEATGWNTQKQVTQTLEAIATKVEQSRIASS